MHLLAVLDLPLGQGTQRFSIEEEMSEATTTSVNMIRLVDPPSGTIKVKSNFEWLDYVEATGAHRSSLQNGVPI